MSGQPGLFDLDERYLALSKTGDPLERLASVVDFEMFRVELDAALDQRNSDAEKDALNIPDDWKARPAKLRQKDRDGRWTLKRGRRKRRPDGTLDRRAGLRLQVPYRRRPAPSVHPLDRPGPRPDRSRQHRLQPAPIPLLRDESRGGVGEGTRANNRARAFRTDPDDPDRPIPGHNPFRPPARAENRSVQLRQTVIHTRQKLATSERRTCKVIGLAKSTMQYSSVPKDDDALRLATATA